MTVKELIKALIDLPMTAEVGVCIVNVNDHETEGVTEQVKLWNPFYVEIICGENDE